MYAHTSQDITPQMGFLFTSQSNYCQRQAMVYDKGPAGHTWPQKSFGPALPGQVRKSRSFSRS